MTAGQLMREARLRAGLSQRELGVLIDRPAPQIARWERGIVDPGFALVQRVMRACGFDLDEQLVPWADEFRESLEQNLRTPPAERFARALDRCGKACLAGAPRRILGELEAAGVAYCLIGGLAASIRGAERLSIGVDIAPGLDPENERRLDDALARLGSKPSARRLLSKLEGFSDMKTPAGLLRIVVQPHGTRGFDRDLRRVSSREHLGLGPYDLVRLTPKTAERQAEELRLGGRGLQPVVAGAADLVRMAGATVRGTRDDRVRELRRLAELEALSPR